MITADNRVPAAQAEAKNEEKLADIRVNLRTALAIIGKCVAQGHYNTVIRHSTSLRWIYESLRSDYNIQSKGIHFFNILDLKFDAEGQTPVSFYNQYRTLVINNLSKAGDTIKYKNNENLDQDERMSPMIEDLVLLNVLKEIDSRLPAFVRNHYNHKMKNDDRIMDFKTDILVNVNSFIQEMESTELISGNQDASLNAFKQMGRRKFKKPYVEAQLYCRVCWLAKLPKDVYTSHNIGDYKC